MTDSAAPAKKKPTIKAESSEDAAPPSASTLAMSMMAPTALPKAASSPLVRAETQVSAAPAAPAAAAGAIVTPPCTPPRRAAPKQQITFDIGGLCVAPTSDEEVVAQRLLLHRLVDVGMDAFMLSEFAVVLRSGRLPLDVQQQAWMLVVQRISKQALSVRTAKMTVAHSNGASSSSSRTTSEVSE
jgi:hypothetical protein